MKQGEIKIQREAENPWSHNIFVKIKKKLFLGISFKLNG